MALCLNFEGLDYSPFDLRDIPTESLFRYEIIKLANEAGFKWLNNRKRGPERAKVRNLKLTIGNKKDFTDVEYIVKKLEPTGSLKIQWLNDNGSKFLVFMKQLSKEVNLQCDYLMIRVSGDIMDADYESFGLVRVKRRKHLWLDGGTYLSLSKPNQQHFLSVLIAPQMREATFPIAKVADLDRVHLLPSCNRKRLVVKKDKEDEQWNFTRFKAESRKHLTERPDSYTEEI